MAPKFGTSGLRGLVVELTPGLVADYTRAFLAAVPSGGGLWLGRDLRESSPAIADAVRDAARAEGVPVTDCGALPTPALALAALRAGQAAVMVTGSHIPADRNGLKFYAPSGEITKADEAAILAALGRAPARGAAPVGDGTAAAAEYVARYVRAFGPGALSGLRIGVWEHSSVAREVLARVLAATGAEVVALGRSDSFVPVDTEAVGAGTRDRLADWAARHGLDAVVSTDGDADRPMLADASGRIVPGDLLGPLVAGFLGAEIVVTPVSSNTAVDLAGACRVIRTRIGSPFVIAAMEEVLAQDPGAKVAGYEANGGFLLGFEAMGPAGPLAPLMTRDSLLPILAPLAAARAQGIGIAELAARLPGRFTASDRLQGIEAGRSAAFLARLGADPGGFLARLGLGAEVARDETDGLRLHVAGQEGAGQEGAGDEIVHLRPSGNAPEFRVYVEAASPARAEALLAQALERVAQALEG
ncbi:phosphomannomutase [Pseudogemmobacter sonorensis]|uniref:phosphomannomutase n=1 Tax=Pseudogemmobacter sonorensis TaxID=2989681 RepID=UPI0036A59DB3